MYSDHPKPLSHSSTNWFDEASLKQMWQWPPSRSHLRGWRHLSESPAQGGGEDVPALQFPWEQVSRSSWGRACNVMFSSPQSHSSDFAFQWASWKSEIRICPIVFIQNYSKQEHLHIFLWFLSLHISFGSAGSCKLVFATMG